MIDYRALLIKYMQHIGQQEGTCFVGLSLVRAERFTEEERDELVLLAVEAEE